jgi:2-polyprenyl-3-methyl-5-hydroxy-6-metoxy-1,4-benzoquinol methylase
MLIKKTCKALYKLTNNFFNKFGFEIVRPGGYDFLFDCSFQPYSVEYISAPENIQKVLLHIEKIWSDYGKNEAHWSVLTHDAFLKKNLDQDNVEIFYATGKDTMLQVENTLRRCGEWDSLGRKNCMEYGCGVGRVSFQLAKHFESVTALDISQGHIELAQQRADTSDVKNIIFKKINTLDSLTPESKYDFIFSIIVLQHNPPPIIALIIERFFKQLKSDGIAMFQVPVQIAGYSFSIDDYVAKMHKEKTMEMHMLPQNVIFEIARKNNCYPLEVHNDGWTGSPEKYVSQSFVFKKMG